MPAQSDDANSAPLGVDLVSKELRAHRRLLHLLVALALTLLLVSIVELTNRRSDDVSHAPPSSAPTHTDTREVVGGPHLPLPNNTPRSSVGDLCVNNLQSIGTYYLLLKSRHALPTRGGTQFIRVFTDLAVIPPGRESILVCPHDPYAPLLTPEVPIDAQRRIPTSARSAQYSSYVFRDLQKYPLDATSAGTTAIAADRQGRDGRTPHHAEGLYVLFDDGSVKFMDRKALGLKDTEPIVVGPHSASYLLRQLTAE